MKSKSARGSGLIAGCVDLIEEFVLNDLRHQTMNCFYGCLAAKINHGEKWRLVQIPRKTDTAYRAVTSTLVLADLQEEQIVKVMFLSLYLQPLLSVLNHSMCCINKIKQWKMFFLCFLSNYL